MITMRSAFPDRFLTTETINDNAKKAANSNAKNEKETIKNSNHTSLIVSNNDKIVS